MPIQQSARGLLAQLVEVMDQLSDDDFKKPIDTLSGSSVGQHIRHTIEFFLCLMDGANKGEINYDERRHDKFIETDRKLAISVIQSIDEFLAGKVDDHPMNMVANYEVEGEDVVSIPSSLYRELAYNIEHAIHHMALIKIGVRAIGEHVSLPEHFGVASSTVRYQKQQS